MVSNIAGIQPEKLLKISFFTNLLRILLQLSESLIVKQLLMAASVLYI